MDVHSKIIPFELHPMGLIEVFADLGADIDLLLKGTDISRGMFGRRGSKISYQQQSVLLRNGIHLCDIPGLGLIVGLKMDWSYYGTVGSVVSCSPTLKSAGAAMKRFMPLVQPHYATHADQPSIYMNRRGLMINPLRYTPVFQQDPTLQQFEADYRLAITLRLFDQCGNKNVARPDICVSLNYPKPANCQAYEQLPCQQLLFNAKQSSVSCHYSVIVTPWREMRSGTYRRIIDQCEKELKQTHPNTSIASKVRWHVSLYYNEQVTLDQIAEALSLSPRALTRKLANEATNFRQIVHQVRMELTAIHLQASDLNVDEVAELMGFSSPSSLRRAIKNWSGETAGTLRSRSPSDFHYEISPRHELEYAD